MHALLLGVLVIATTEGAANVLDNLPASEDIPSFTDLPTDPCAPTSKIAPFSGSGPLHYADWNDRQDRLPDWSYAGYLGGGQPIPDLPVRTILSPVDGDNRKLIQGAIDALARTDPDADGFRGTILLRKGVYHVSGTINVHAGGIVIRGEGNHKGGTIVVATTKEGGEGNQKSVLFNIGGIKRSPRKGGQETEITTDYVPVGARTFQVRDASAFKVGDEILLLKRVNEKWLRDTNHAGLPSWDVNRFSYQYQKKIVAIDGNTVTVDVPMVDAVNQKYGGGAIYTYSWPERIEKCGIENLLLVSQYDPAVMRGLAGAQSDFGYLNVEPFDYPCDEKHAAVAVQFSTLRDGWARNLRSYYFTYSLVRIQHEASRVTVQDSQALDPVGLYEGARKYSFCIYGQQNLVQRCYTRNDRHAFVVQFRVPGPNVFLNCVASATYNFTEPHLQWATGVLYDNVKVTGPFAIFCATWRGFLNDGSHGWAAANTLLWNCSSNLVYALNPPTARNMVVGFKPLQLPNKQGVIATMEAIFKDPAGKTHHYDGTALMGNAYAEHLDQYVAPQSLYHQQLRDRLGQGAIGQISAETK